MMQELYERAVEISQSGTGDVTIGGTTFAKAGKGGKSGLRKRGSRGYESALQTWE
jgi:hypothetical protein